MKMSFIWHLKIIDKDSILIGFGQQLFTKLLMQQKIIRFQLFNNLNFVGMKLDGGAFFARYDNRSNF